jgi:tetratricopeptide (TPR) repeat protein
LYTAAACRLAAAPSGITLNGQGRAGSEQLYMSYPFRKLSSSTGMQSGAPAPSNPMDDELVGFELAERYRIVELIGTGGWGNVYRGQHLTLGTDVAIKVIHRHLSRNEASLRRLEQEAKLLSRLESQYIVRIIDYGLEPFPYIVMEYFDGLSLSSWIKEKGPLDYGLATELFMQMCDGMSNARELGLVHRDLKPGNVLLKIEEGRLRSKILDFGLAKLVDESGGAEKLTTTGEILGSPPYMSPEQWTGRTDHRSDIYSFGCIMYEVLSGKPAFSAEYGMDYLNKHVSIYPERMRDVSTAIKFPLILENVVRKCLQKNPNNRYQTSAALKADLEQIKAGRKVKIRLPEERKLFCRRNIAIASAAVLLAGAGACFFREPLLVPLADGISAKADRDKNAGKAEQAIAGYRQTILIGKVLAARDKRKLHAMRMLAVLLKERKEWQESGNLEKEVQELVGSKVWPQWRLVMQHLVVERDQRSDYASAEGYARQLMTEAASHYGEQSVAYAAALDVLGSIQRLRGNLEPALQNELQASKICEELLEPDDSLVSQMLNNLGQVFSQLKRYDDAEKIYRQAISINSKSGNLKEVSTNYNNLASVYLYRHKFDEALVFFGKSLELCQNQNGKNGVSILNNMAQVYVLKKDFPKAIEYFKKCLDLRAEERSANLPEAEFQWTNLGKVYFTLQDYAKAEECFERALKIRDKDNYSGRTVINLRNLMTVKRKLGKEAEAAELQARLSKVLGVPLRSIEGATGAAGAASKGNPAGHKDLVPES